MEPLDNSSKAAKLEQNADNLQKSITNDQLIDKSSFYQYPTPVHDTLAGFDWIRNNLQPEQLGVFGTHVGGSLALMLALTEAQLVRAVTALEPVCDWPGLDEYCISEDSPETQPKSSTDESTGSDSFSLTSAMKQKRPSKRKGFRGAVAPPDLVPLLDAREQFFARPEKYFDAFASPVLFLRSAGRDVPRAFPQYLTGPEYPIPTIKSAAKPIPAENYSALNGSLWDRDVYPDVDIGSEDSDISETSSGPVIRRRKAMSRWPPYGLDYGLSGSALSGPSHGIGRLQMTLPWVRIFLPDGSLSSLVSLHNSRRTKTKETETEVTILARQAEEMVSVMQRACFWGQEKGVGERRVTLSAVPISDADGTVELDEVGIWLKDALDGSMEK
ncbi:Alpha/beta hydrolase fold-3 [Penicillium lagena]|uniref:Alpha/beta hydrolase fold-3 n=1 Tax=Penicillium lagena TaxID=94218 RepID=UPI0025403F02|nr:Alpha/beta hydrolase fold-3 [Penicillium lagena]KAJ5612576.1 Alpha/beta hydrolase fold-3 [Penicillium lagena]